MFKNRELEVARIQTVHAAAFSLNAALATMALALLYAPFALISRLNTIEYFFNGILHVRQTDLIRGYWEFFIPGLALSLCLWVVLQLSSSARLTKEILSSVAGIAALTVPPAYWLCVTYAANRRYGWDPFHSLAFYEAFLVLILAALYMRATRAVAPWVPITILLAHYGFWLSEFWPQLRMALGGFGSSPSIISVVAFLAGLTWIIYILRIQQLGTARS